MARTRPTRPQLPPPFRETPQRRAVLDALAALRAPFTALQLYERARERHPGLGIATAYRTLDLLRRMGAVRPLAGDGSTYVRCGPEHHHHLVCVSCGSVQETELCAAPSAAELKRKHGFVPASHEVEIFGTCARCA